MRTDLGCVPEKLPLSFGVEFPDMSGLGHLRHRDAPLLVACSPRLSNQCLGLMEAVNESLNVRTYLCR